MAACSISWMKVTSCWLKPWLNDSRRIMKAAKKAARKP